MTHDEMIAVIQANKEGKQIEWKSNITGQWLQLNAVYISFNFKEFEYRIKPTCPKEIWVHVNDGSGTIGHGYSKDEFPNLTDNLKSRLVKYVLAE